MTTYRLKLTSREADLTPGRILADGTTEDPAVMAATLRAVADQLDPPKPVRPAYRSAADRREAADQRFREGLAGYGDDQATPGRALMPAEIDAMVCPDCTDERHTYERGRCALKPPWNGVAVVDDPGARMDAPDAVLTPKVANAVRKVSRDVLDRARAMEPVRRTRITPDGCGPEHTFTGSCALTPPHRD